MGKHVRTLIGEGAPPPWVPFGIQHTKTGEFMFLFYCLSYVCK
jgi:hypothetical protein